MKKTTMKMLGSLAIAAALAMTTGLTACSSENELTETPIVEQPEQPTAKGVKVTVTAGISDDATTRSEVGTENGKRVLKFTAGDRLYVRGFIGGVGAQAEKILSGFVAIDGQSITSSGKAADFTANYMSDGTGDLKAYVYDAAAGSYVATSHDFGEATDILAECQEVALVLAHSGASFNVNSTTQNYYMAGSTVGEIASTVEELMTTNLTVRGMYNAESHSVALATVDDDGQCSPIFNCTLSGLTASTTYQVDLFQSDGTDETNYPFGDVKTDNSGNVSFACYFSGAEKTELTYKLRFTDNDNNIKNLGLGTRTLASKVYNVTRHWAGNCFAKFVSGEVNLASVTDNIVALDGTTLTGSLANKVKISIAAGAMVTLSGVRINDNDEGTGPRWKTGNYAGLTCLGDATIILADGTMNTVRSFEGDYPGIEAAHNDTGSGEEYTLTIRGGSLGTGQLISIGRTSGAGIGSAEASDCGNITIEGGIVNATSNAAGIGSGAGSSSRGATCGDITITGGTVTAKGGVYCGAGIGSCGCSSNTGYGSSCGDILITGGNVTATGDSPKTISLGGAGIGSGGNAKNAGTCGTITINLSSGSVTAKGGAKAAGIGTGINGTCGVISVNVSNENYTVTADRNEGNGGTGYYDIGTGGWRHHQRQRHESHYR